MHDELRRLDDELGAGRLDADSYRRRRDELLAAPGTGPDPVPAPVPDPATDDPFPPPFRWATPVGAGDATDATDATDVAGPGPDVTQVVAGGPAADRTQVVPGLPGGGDPEGRFDAAATSPCLPALAGTAPGDPTRVVGRDRIPDAVGRAPWTVPPERTQLVPGAVLARSDDRRPVPERRTVPPWADDRPGLAPDVVRQGREVFVRGGGPSPGAVAGTAAVVLVVLAVLVLSFTLS